MKPATIDPVFFAFERDFVETLRCIPMVVRYKLDACVLKLNLSEWVKLTSADKAQLAAQPCYTPSEINQYRLDLIALVQQRCQCRVSELGEVNAVWERLNEVPETIQQKVLERGYNPLTIQEVK